VDVDGAVVMRKRITRAKLLDFFATLPSCLVGIEACPTAHYWSRRLQALGHTVRLLPPSYVKAYLKRSKNDANDAAAICEAVTRPSTRPPRLNDGLTSSIIAQQRRHGRATCSTSGQRTRNPHRPCASCISWASIAVATRRIQRRSSARPMNP